MLNNEWFKLWFSSPYYNILYYKRNKEEATAFTASITSYLQMPSNSLVLEAACGNGRYSVALAEKGFNVIGVDISAPAITAAKNYETDKLHFYLHDIRLPFYINYFDYAFNFFTSFGYFRTLRENNDAMRTIAQSLKPNGIFTIDYLNVHFTEDNLVPIETLQIEGVDFDITRWYDNNYIYKRIHVRDAARNTDEIFT